MDPSISTNGGAIEWVGNGSWMVTGNMTEDAAFDLKRVVDDCLAGQESAVTKLIRRYHALVFSLCFRMLGQRQDAEDATQETFARVVRSLSQWDSSRRFEPWLLTVAGNRCRTKMARRMSRPTPQSLEGDVQERSGSETGLILEEVRAALDLLRPEYREAFSLFHIDQRSFEEIGQIMQVPYATAKTWCHRARRELAEILARRGNLADEIGKV